MAVKKFLSLDSLEWYDNLIKAEISYGDSSAIETAKKYADNKSSDAISSHNVSGTAHSDIRGVITEISNKLDNFLGVDDTTVEQLSEIISLINDNKDTLESLTNGKVNVSDIVDDLTTPDASKVLSANQGVAIKALIDALQNLLDEHTHEIADVSDLRSALDGKAERNHGTHVTYANTAPVMDGTASVGSSTDVSRADHIHPVDTSRAAKADFDALKSVVENKSDSDHDHTTATTSASGFMSPDMVTSLYGLQVAVEDIQEITSAEIVALFA